MIIDIGKIIIGDRARKDMGDLHALARSIADIGLLHPIVVTDDLHLVCGERRLRACRDILGLDRVKVTVANIEALALGERDENEVRKDFTVSERVEIGRRVEEKLGERRGRPSDEKVQNFAPLGKTRDIAAKRAGFRNPETYRQAKIVTEEGVDELVEAVDRADIAVSAAAQIAKLPPDEQRAVVTERKKPKAEKKPKPKAKRKPRQPKEEAVVVPGRISKLTMWLRTGTWCAADFASGEDAATQAIGCGKPLDVDDLLTVKSFVDGASAELRRIEREKAQRQCRVPVDGMLLVYIASQITAYINQVDETVTSATAAATLFRLAGIVHNEGLEACHSRHRELVALSDACGQGDGE
jgi:ParB family chromosome partitioning protein